MGTHNPVRPDASLDEFERRTFIFEAEREIGTHTGPRLLPKRRRDVSLPFDFISLKSLRVLIHARTVPALEWNISADCKGVLTKAQVSSWLTLDRFLWKGEFRYDMGVITLRF
jgi:hypothetical protein